MRIKHKESKKRKIETVKDLLRGRVIDDLEAFDRLKPLVGAVKAHEILGKI